MASAKLHVICGNCGSNDMFRMSLSRDPEGTHFYIICENCGTLHNLGDNVEIQKLKTEEQFMCDGYLKQLNEERKRNIR